MLQHCREHDGRDPSDNDPGQCPRAIYKQRRRKAKGFFKKKAPKANKTSKSLIHGGIERHNHNCPISVPEHKDN